MTPNTTVGQRIGNQTVDNFALARAVVTSVAGAVTANMPCVSITTEPLTTGSGSTYTFTLTNSLIEADSYVGVSVGNGTITTGAPLLTTVTPSLGSVNIQILNNASTSAFNGTLKLNVLVMQ